MPYARIIEAPFSFKRGRNAFRRLIETGIPPTCVICLNDVLAIGAMAEAHDLGIRVPQDVSISGCEDLEIAASVTPSLTTVRYPTWEMGSVAAEYMLALLEGTPPPEQCTFPSELIVSASPRHHGSDAATL